LVGGPPPADRFAAQAEEVSHLRFIERRFPRSLI
jgi:hypothetical protein